MKKISIVDYGCGNTLSILRALEEGGFSAKITSDKNYILNSDFVILPGVGAFKKAIDLLNNFNLIDTIQEYAIGKKRPLLGICLGMQLLLTKSFEMGEHNGLNLIKGIVKKLEPKKEIVKIPHINWSKIKLNDNLLDEINLKEFNDRYFYFVHSFISITEQKNNTISFCKYYDLEIPAIIKKNNILGCQFHPEKSGKNGLNFLSKIITDL